MLFINFKERRPKVHLPQSNRPRTPHPDSETRARLGPRIGPTEMAARLQRQNEDEGEEEFLESSRTRRPHAGAYLTVGMWTLCRSTAVAISERISEKKKSGSGVGGGGGGGGGVGGDGNGSGGGGVGGGGCGGSSGDNCGSMRSGRTRRGSVRCNVSAQTAVLSGLSVIPG